ncbi:hypothetical protein ALO_17521 [Acetonema longum DSM 6540]|uniref:Uncharacterized protein n=1 Tax=Acetonema longum DSM 6540 TaxID=1009370 RepID=F7NN21_9FIRM|nr:hypothetical protein ALO_17521 [Acetonema longum DSM 6540]
MPVEKKFLTADCFHWILLSSKMAYKHENKRDAWQ